MPLSLSLGHWPLHSFSFWPMEKYLLFLVTISTKRFPMRVLSPVLSVSVHLGTGGGACAEYRNIKNNVLLNLEPTTRPVSLPPPPPPAPPSPRLTLVPLTESYSWCVFLVIPLCSSLLGFGQLLSSSNITTSAPPQLHLRSSGIDSHRSPGCWCQKSWRPLF